MMDPDLQKQLETINSNLVEIKTKSAPGIWRSFFNGMFGALGYMAGLVLVALVLIWYLNKTDMLPEFQKQFKAFQTMMDQAQSLIKAQQGSGQR